MHVEYICRNRYSVAKVKLHFSIDSEDLHHDMGILVGRMELQNINVRIL